MHLVIGGNGNVGSNLTEELHSRNFDYRVTIRHSNPFFLGNAYGDFDFINLPPTSKWPKNMDYVYLVAANSKIAECERDPTAWRVNVDAPIEIAQHYSRNGSAIIFISSDAVETCSGTAYARQKAAAEAYMRTIDAAIIRPGRIAPERAREFAKFVVDVALSHRSGIHRWR